MDDVARKTLFGMSSLTSGVKETLKGKKPGEVSMLVGEAFAKKALEKNITTIVFDRNGFTYHGRVKALADGLRKGGLKF